MADIKIEKVYERDPSIVCRTIDDEIILVPIKQNVGDLESIFSLNEVGARIWELLDGKNNIQKIKEHITTEFDVDDKQAEDDILEFVQKLEEAGALKGE